MKIITVADMRDALLALRRRVGDDTLSHCVQAGRFQLNRVVYDARGKSTVTPLSPWQDAAGHMRTQHVLRHAIAKATQP